MNVYPYLKPTIEIESSYRAPSSQIVARDASDALVMREFVPGLATTYVVDGVNHLRLLHVGDLSTANVTREAIHSAALTNLRVLVADKLRVERHGAICPLLLDGNFEASLLLLDEIWDGISASRVGDLVAAVPARDVLAIAADESAEAIDELRALVNRVQHGDHLLCTRLLVRRARKWELRS